MRMLRRSYAKEVNAISNYLAALTSLSETESTSFPNALDRGSHLLYRNALSHKNVKQIAIETLEEEAQKVDQLHDSSYVSRGARKAGTSIFDTKISGGKVRGTFRCENGLKHNSLGILAKSLTLPTTRIQ